MAGGRCRKAAAPTCPTGGGPGRRGRGQSAQRPTPPVYQDQAIPQSLGELLALIGLATFLMLFLVIADPSIDT
jgi:hypothetical protein